MVHMPLAKRGACVHQTHIGSEQRARLIAFFWRMGHHSGLDMVRGST